MVRGAELAEPSAQYGLLGRGGVRMAIGVNLGRELPEGALNGGAIRSCVETQHAERAYPRRIQTPSCGGRGISSPLTRARAPAQSLVRRERDRCVRRGISRVGHVKSNSGIAELEQSVQSSS